MLLPKKDKIKINKTKKYNFKKISKQNIITKKTLIKRINIYHVITFYLLKEI